jgi:hypothetical protein
MKKPNFSDIKKKFDDAKTQITNVKNADDLKELPKKVPSQVYGGLTLASAAGLAAAAVFPKLRPLTGVFQATAMTSVGLATSNISEDRRQAAEHYKTLRAQVAADALKGNLKTKAAKNLTDEDAVRLSMLSDLQLGQLPKGHQAEALKVQIALAVHEGHKKNRYFAPPLTFFNKTNRYLHSSRGVDLLSAEREMVQTMLKAPAGASGPIQKAASRYTNMRMASRLMNKSKTGRKISKKVNKVKKSSDFMNKAFMVTQTKDVLKDSTKIMSHRPLPRFKDADSFVEYNLARLHQANDTLDHIKTGRIKPLGAENIFRKP